MKAGLRPKRFFYDIVPIPKAEMDRIREALKKDNGPLSKNPLTFDSLRTPSRIEREVERIWTEGRAKEEPVASENEADLRYTLEEAAENALRHEQEEVTKIQKRIRLKTFVRNSLILLFKLSIIALIIYNGLSLYFEKEGLKEKIMNLAVASKVHFAIAAESVSSLDRGESSSEIDKAGEKLLEIRRELLDKGEYNYILPNHPLVKDQLTQGQNLLELGLMIKDTNSDLNGMLDAIITKGDDKTLKDKVLYIGEKVSLVKQRIDRADLILTNNKELKNYLGPEFSSKVEGIIKKSDYEIDNVSKILGVAPLIFGANGDNRYLVLFMNNAEMRPGGGFPGNYGVVSFKNNNLSDLFVNDIYALNWYKKEEIKEINESAQKGIDPNSSINLPVDLVYPEPILENAKKMDITNYWTMSFANWNLDFRDNARRANYLFENLYQQGSVAGTIALTPNVVEDVLRIVGPIKMDDYNIEVSADNFRDIMEYKVEVDNSFKKEDRHDINPKQVLVDFGPLFMAKVGQSDLGTKIKIMESLAKNIKQKEIILYHKDPAVEKVIADLGYGGEVKDVEGDFLGVSTLNLTAMKNGRKIEKEAKLISQVSKLGFAMDTLELTLTNREDNPRYLHGAEDSYVEILTPDGSRIREAKVEGRDIIGSVDYFQEAGKIIFGFIVHLEPGEAKNIVLKYQAPLKSFADKGYSLYLYKQPGATPIEFSGEINFENNDQNGNNALIFKRSIDTDFVVKN